MLGCNFQFSFNNYKKIIYYDKMKNVSRSFQRWRVFSWEKFAHSCKNGGVRVQVSPHFFFNAINNRSGSVSLQARTVKKKNAKYNFTLCIKNKRCILFLCNYFVQVTKYSILNYKTWLRASKQFLSLNHQFI